MHDFLAATNCVHAEIQLQELGALDGGDLHEATDGELMELGMKKLEVKRLRRGLGQHLLPGRALKLLCEFEMKDDLQARTR